MIIVQGKKTAEIGREEFEQRIAPYDVIHLDVGTGDGLFASDLAAKRPELFVIGMDPVADAMTEQSGRALRPKTRQENLLFVMASVEQMPTELDGLANQITINLPWGSLMRGLILAEPEIMRPLARVAAPKATLEAILNLRIFDDPVPVEVRNLPDLTPEYVERQIAPEYKQYGYWITEARHLSPEEMRDLRTTWSRRLSHRRPPPSLLIRAERRDNGDD